MKARNVKPTVGFTSIEVDKIILLSILFLPMWLESPFALEFLVDSVCMIPWCRTVADGALLFIYLYVHAHTTSWLLPEDDTVELLQGGHRFPILDGDLYFVSGGH